MNGSSRILLDLAIPPSCLVLFLPTAMACVWLSSQHILESYNQCSVNIKGQHDQEKASRSNWVGHASVHISKITNKFRKKYVSAPVRVRRICSFLVINVGLFRCVSLGFFCRSPGLKLLHMWLCGVLMRSLLRREDIKTTGRKQLNFRHTFPAKKGSIRALSIFIALY